MRKKVIVIFVSVLALLAVTHGHAVFADNNGASGNGKDFQAKLVNLVAGGGTIVFDSKQNGYLRFRTVAEVADAIIDCNGDQVCKKAGGLEGDVLVAGTYRGKVEAQITGKATCGEYGGDPCGWLLFDVVDRGNWNVPELGAHGAV